MASTLRFMVYVFAMILAFTIIANAQSIIAENPGDNGDFITSIPLNITYQGILKDNIGNPVPDESLNITFRILDDPIAGDLVWEDELAITADDDGLFTASLANLNIPLDEDYYLE